MLSRVFSRCLSSAANERRNLLKKVYAPFANLDPKSIEYQELARSGKVWEDYHRPADSEKLGYTRLQKECRNTLEEIDGIRKSMRRPVSLVAKQLVAEYAHQSVQIEGSHLDCGESYKIRDFLAGNFFLSVGMPPISLRDLTEKRLPDVSGISPEADQSQIIELRNHIVASRWIAETAPHAPGTDGLCEDDVLNLSALTMKDLGPDGFFPWGWGDRVRLGEYRKTPISVRSNSLRIFPYHDEVPACMRRYYEWREKAHREKKLHPLILACQATAYFVHIHPFPDGNGRVSRMIMQDYMARQGYPPVVMLALEREDYLTMISDALDGRPDDFVNRVITTQLDITRTFHFREFETHL